MEIEIAALRGLLEECKEEVDSQLRVGREEGLTDGTIRRWLIARKMHVHTAAHDIKEHARWRAAWAPQGRILESEIQADIAHRKIFLQGTDAQGRAVLVLQVRKHCLTDDLAQQRFMCYVLDACIRAADTSRNPDSKVVAIFDLSGLALKNLDGVGLRNVFHMLQSHYVERLSVLYMFAAPTIFWGLWKVVKPFIDPVTVKKVAFIGPKELDVLQADIGPELLPCYLGGAAELIPVEEAVASFLSPIKQQQRAQVVAQQLSPPNDNSCGQCTPQLLVAAS